MRTLLFLIACNATTPAHVGPPWLEDARVLVDGVHATNRDCRADICVHNENVDMIAWKGALYMVHRTARSQVLGPNCSWFVYRSIDQGKTWTRAAHLLGPDDRDLRDPHFYTIGDELWLFGGTRLPVVPTHDDGIDAIEVAYKTSDGDNWQSLGNVGPIYWTFWRAKQRDGVWYNAAYHDGDSQVSLFSSSDGSTWTLGPDVYNLPEDHEEETELVFMPSGALLALVRLDGTDAENLGDVGRLREKVCWSMPPYTAFDCPQELTPARFDGPLAFFWKDRLFVVARKHIQSDTQPKKRMALFEITGDFLDAGPIDFKEWGEFPSAGDTAYAGAAPIDDHRFAIAWYSSDLTRDENWLISTLGETDIWAGILDLQKL